MFNWEPKKYQSLDKIFELIIYEIVMIMSNIRENMADQPSQLVVSTVLLKQWAMGLGIKWQAGNWVSREMSFTESHLRKTHILLIMSVINALSGSHFENALSGSHFEKLFFIAL